MVKSVDGYWKHMEKVILGTRFVPQEHENQFANAAFKRCNKKGKGHVCPFCNVGFWGKKDGKIKCPSCDQIFKVEDK